MNAEFRDWNLGKYRGFFENRTWQFRGAQMRLFKSMKNGPIQNYVQVPMGMSLQHKEQTASITG